MPTIHAKGDITTITPVRNGNSVYLLLSRELLDYIGFSEKEIEDYLSGKTDLPIVLKYDYGSWGSFVGLGKKGKH